MNNKKYDGALYDVEYVETIKDFVDRSTTKYKNKIAYMYKDVHGRPFKKMTYGEFGAAKDALGTALIDMGLKDSKISIIGENSHQWALSYFTICCGVGTVVPIDKNLEKDEIINLMSRADVDLIFVSRQMLDKVGAVLDEVEKLKHLVILDAPGEDLGEYLEDERVTTQSALIEKGSELLKQGRREYLDAVVGPEDLSTILFTSGTTGLAKGVMLSHRNLAQNVFNMSKYVNVPKNGRVLSVLPMHHAYEMSCTVMTCFYQGATVVVCEGLKYIQTNFVEAKCCIMLGVPLIFENIYRKIWSKAKKSGEDEKLSRAIGISKRLNFKNSRAVTKKMFRSVHDIFGDDLYLLIAGGAAIDPKVIIEFEAMGMPMIQGYGMTENAPIIAVNSDRYGKAASAGKAMPGTEIRIIDKDNTGIGEIICKGPSVMMGYYKDPENTAKTIIDGWLHTGDFGFLDEDGFLYVTGRKKNVIVTKGGKNIFPEEVEYYLLLNEAVSEVIVYGKPEEKKGDLICTAIIYPNYANLATFGCKTDKDIYKRLCDAVEKANEKMPPYKRVKRIEVRDREFVKTTTLKIKRFEEENYDYKFDDRTFDPGKRF